MELAGPVQVPRQLDELVLGAARQHAAHRAEVHLIRLVADDSAKDDFNTLMLDLVGDFQGEGAADLVPVLEEQALVRRRRQLKGRLWGSTHGLGGQVRCFRKQAAHETFLLGLLFLVLIVQIVACAGVLCLAAATDS